MRAVWQPIRNLGFLFLWLVTITWMYTNYGRDPYDPGLVGTQAYGHNHKGSLQQGVLLTLAEMIVLYAIVRPWSFSGSRYRRWRIAAAFLVLIPWTTVTAAMSMHGGGILMIHSFWLVLAGAVLMGALAASFITSPEADSDPDE